MEDGRPSSANSRTGRGTAAPVIEYSINIIVVREKERRLISHGVQIRLYAGIIALELGRVQRREYNRRENADNGDYDEQFNKSEPAIVA